MTSSVVTSEVAQSTDNTPEVESTSTAAPADSTSTFTTTASSEGTSSLEDTSTVPPHVPPSGFTPLVPTTPDPAVPAGVHGGVIYVTDRFRYRDLASGGDWQLNEPGQWGDLSSCTPDLRLCTLIIGNHTNEPDEDALLLIHLTPGEAPVIEPLVVAPEVLDVPAVVRAESVYLAQLSADGSRIYTMLSNAGGVQYGVIFLGPDEPRFEAIDFDLPGAENRGILTRTRWMERAIGLSNEAHVDRRLHLWDNDETGATIQDLGPLDVNIFDIQMTADAQHALIMPSGGSIEYLDLSKPGSGAQQLEANEFWIAPTTSRAALAQEGEIKFVDLSRGYPVEPVLPLPPGSYLHNSLFEPVQFSPDGQQLAFLAVHTGLGDSYHSRLWWVDVSGESLGPTLDLSTGGSHGDVNVDWLSFADDGKALIYQAGIEWDHDFIVTINDGNPSAPELLFPSGQVSRYLAPTCSYVVREVIEPYNRTHFQLARLEDGRAGEYFDGPITEWGSITESATSPGVHALRTSDKVGADVTVRVFTLDLTTSIPRFVQLTEHTGVSGLRLGEVEPVMSRDLSAVQYQVQDSAGATDRYVVFRDGERVHLGQNISFAYFMF